MRGTTTAGPRRRRCYRTAPIQQQPRHAHSELGLHQKCACWQHAARRAPASQSLARADAPRSPRANMTDTHTHATLELHTDRIGQAGGPQACRKVPEQNGADFAAKSCQVCCPIATVVLRLVMHRSWLLLGAPAILGAQAARARLCVSTTLKTEPERARSG